MFAIIPSLVVDGFLLVKFCKAEVNGMDCDPGGSYHIQNFLIYKDFDKYFVYADLSSMPFALIAQSG